MTSRRYGGVTVGETAWAESTAAVVGTAPAVMCIAHAIWPHCHCALLSREFLRLTRTGNVMMYWPSFTTTNDVVAAALIVTLLVLGILFASLFLADKLGRKSRQKR